MIEILTFLFQNNILSFSDDGWNQIQFNLADFTRRAYGTNYVETLRVQIHANCRIRRVYFSDRLYSEDELPAEFKLYLPVSSYLIKILRWLSFTFNPTKVQSYVTYHNQYFLSGPTKTAATITTTAKLTAAGQSTVCRSRTTATKGR